MRLFIIVILFVIFPLFAVAENYGFQPVDESDKNPAEALAKADCSYGGISRDTKAFQPSSASFSHDEPAIEPVDYIDQALCKKVLLSAPKQLQETVLALLNQSNVGQLIPQKLLLVGPPGVGKTTLAIAIAQITQRECCMVRAPFVADQYKNSGAKNLETIFQSIIEKEQPCVVIIDEINCLTDQHQNPHNTDANMAEALWIALDICKQHPHILVVATTNDPTKMPVQLKNRFEGCTVEIPIKDTFEQRREILNFYFKKWPCTVTESIISYCAQKTKALSARQLEELVRQAALRAALYDQEQPEILKNDIQTTLQNFNKSHKLLFPLITSDYKQFLWYTLIYGSSVCSLISLFLSIIDRTSLASKIKNWNFLKNYS